MRIALLAAIAVLSVGCATVTTTPTEVALPVTDIVQTFGLAGMLRVQANTPLVLAIVDGQKAYCSARPVAFNPGEGRGACFFDNSGAGVFDQWYMLGTLSATKMSGIMIPYSIMSMAEFRANPVQPAPPTAIIVQAPSVGGTDAVGAALGAASIAADIHRTNAINNAVRALNRR